MIMQYPFNNITTPIDAQNSVTFAIFISILNNLTLIFSVFSGFLKYCFVYVLILAIGSTVYGPM